MPRTIRFGVLCADFRLSAWKARCVEDLAALPGVECALVLRPTGSAEVRHASDRGSRLFDVYRDLWSRPRALRVADVAPQLAGAPVLEFAELDEETGQKIASFGLDFVLHLDGPEPDGSLLELARHGVWTFHVGNQPGRRPLLFWELALGDEVVEAALCRVVGAGCAIPLVRGRFRIVRHSYRRSLDEVCFACTHWPRQVCLELQNEEADCLAGAEIRHPVWTAPLPGVGSMLRFVAGQLSHLFAQVVRDLFRHEQWTPGVADRPIESFLDAQDLSDVKWMPALGNQRYLADPFAARSGDEIFVLAEYYDHGTARGTIAAFPLDVGARAPAPVSVIEGAGHLSYPYVFEHDGDTYCIPESSDVREIALYRADALPERWTRVATLLEDVAAADATLFRHAGRFWIAFNDAELGRHRDLCLYHAEALAGPWKPHAGNPVLTDVCCARPAGTPFVHEGELYRPGQDCSSGYGKAIRIQRITRLTPTSFREVPAAILRPDPHSEFADGVHTLSAAGTRTLLDAKRYVFNPLAMLRVLHNALKKRL